MRFVTKYRRRGYPALSLRILPAVSLPMRFETPPLFIFTPENLRKFLGFSELILDEVHFKKFEKA